MGPSGVEGQTAGCGLGGTQHVDVVAGVLGVAAEGDAAAGGDDLGVAAGPARTPWPRRR